MNKQKLEKLLDEIYEIPHWKRDGHCKFNQELLEALLDETGHTKETETSLAQEE